MNINQKSFLVDECSNSQVLKIFVLRQAKSETTSNSSCPSPSLVCVFFADLMNEYKVVVLALFNV